MTKKWVEELLDYLEEKYGNDYSGRVMKHLAWIETYPEYGAPSHMNFVLIKALIYALDSKDEQ